jgi:hypothetical protein
MTDNDLKLEKHDDQQGLNLLFDEWLALMEDVPNRCFYHYPDWFRAYFTSRDRVDPPISFFAVRRGPVLVAVIPLQRKSTRKIGASTQLVLPVESQLYLPDVAISAAEEPGEIIALLLDTIGPRYGWAWDRFIVAQALEGSLISRALERQVGRTLRTRNIGLCSVVPVRPYDETLTRMRAKYRQNLNRSRRMIASLDNAEFAVITEMDDVLSTFEEFVELEACGWKGGKGAPRGDVLRPSAIALNEKKRRFYESAIRSFAERGAVEIFCLRAEGKLIGAEVWLVFGDTCYALKTAYDENFSRMSPGVMAFDLGYQHHAAAGNTSNINTITSTPAVDDWLPEKLQVRTYDLFNSTLRGRFFAATATIRDLLRSRSGGT